MQGIEGMRSWERWKRHITNSWAFSTAANSRHPSCFRCYGDVCWDDAQIELIFFIHSSVKVMDFERRYGFLSRTLPNLGVERKFPIDSGTKNTNKSRRRTIEWISLILRVAVVVLNIIMPVRFVVGILIHGLHELFKRCDGNI
ncbi:hypothetical protein L1987_53557 [Smallanthus sonchifolius]|uniref:Uncharacterized protein n=1 Tax=Smallanthus sonchifolius TaxID=185202 RepID=A0ACB9EXG5_9ASTR|nr:hypothetical protein L1987_53557 [Smallanthus sonchifolius]